MSKSSANPRRYSKGKEGLDVNERLIVYVELRVPRDQINTLDTRVRYLASRRPFAVIDFYGVRNEGPTYVATIGVDMGTMRAALKDESRRLKHGYDLLWDIWDQLYELEPVFAGPPTEEEALIAFDMGLKLDLENNIEETEEEKAEVDSK